jgi:predicted esterase YcpF (UPF0227 family)
MKNLHVVYFHGFASSPNSSTVTQLRKVFPDLYAARVPFRFTQNAIKDLTDELRGYLSKNAKKGQRVVFVGTSLGGFFAIKMAEAFDCPVVAINPSTNPSLELKQYLGRNEIYGSNAAFDFTQGDLKSFQSAKLKNGPLVKVLVGSQDKVISPEKSKRLFSNVSVYNTGHRFENIAPIIAAINEIDQIAERIYGKLQPQ